MLEDTSTGQIRVVATVINVLGLLFACYGCYGLWYDWNMDSWAKAPGTIVSIRKLLTTPAPEGDGMMTTNPGIEVLFTYTAHGEEFTGTNFTNLTPEELWEAQIDRWVQAYPAGRHTVIRYDPDDPTRAHVVIMPEYQQAFGMCVVGFAGLVMGMWLGLQRL